MKLAAAAAAAAAGEHGEPGPKGDKGDVGPQGPEGAAGKAGEPGGAGERPRGPRPPSEFVRAYPSPLYARECPPGFPLILIAPAEIPFESFPSLFRVVSESSSERQTRRNCRSPGACESHPSLFRVSESI